jgi:response regulator of citrate/malate metabolism
VGRASATRYPAGQPGADLLWQAMGGCVFRDRTTADALARDHGISRATAYRYLDEVVAVLVAQAPDLRQGR